MYKCEWRSKPESPDEEPLAIPRSDQPFKTGVIADIRELSQDPTRSVKHIEIKANGIKYQTGDHACVLPRNSPELVARVAKRMQVNLDAWFSFEFRSSNHRPSVIPAMLPRFPSPCTVRQALSVGVDVLSMPTQSLIEQLAPYAKDAKQQQRLISIAQLSPQGMVRSMQCTRHIPLTFRAAGGLQAVGDRQSA